MNWETFYLICFFLGLMLSVVSLLGGIGHFGGHLHVPHVGHVAHVPHLPPAGHAVQTAQGNGAGATDFPWWNSFSIMIFLCWFGAAGYLLTRYGGFLAGVVLVLAALCGVAGGAIIFFFIAKVLLPHERELTADETDVVGAVGRVSSTIRAGGTGEMVYEQLGALRSVAVRSESGESIQKQEEVFVVRCEKGIAYVCRWDDAGDSRGLNSPERGSPDRLGR